MVVHVWTRRFQPVTSPTTYIFGDYELSCESLLLLNISNSRRNFPAAQNHPIDLSVQPQARMAQALQAESDFQRQLIMEENETVIIDRGYESDGSIEELVCCLDSEGSTHGSSSGNYQDSVLHDPSCNSHDLDEPNRTTDMLESIESETENLLSERMVARAAHLEEAKDLVDANHSRDIEAFESEAEAEWSIQETSPLFVSQLVAQSRQRTHSMLAFKQTLEKFHIPLNMIPRVDDAMDNERQLVVTVTKAARDAGEQQKQLRDIEQKSYHAYLALIEKQHKERMELSNTFRKEKERHLNLWAASRTDTLDIVQSIESNSQHLLETLNILVETMKKHESKLEAEVRRVRVETSKSSKSECQVCYEYIEGPSRSGWLRSLRTRDVKQRSCLIPCNHAMICLPCATEIWQSTKSCPFCKEKLTTKPTALYLG